MKVTKVKPVSNITNITRRDKPFEGSDSLMEFHRAKAKASLSEAYKDADYATPISRTNSEWEDFVEFAKGLAIVVPLIALLMYFAYSVFTALGILVVRV
jgi:hypothetical protein